MELNNQTIIQLNVLLKGNKLREITSDVNDKSRAFIFFKNGVLHVKDIHFSLYLDEKQATQKEVDTIITNLKNNTQNILSK